MSKHSGPTYRKQYEARVPTDSGMGHGSTHIEAWGMGPHIQRHGAWGIFKMCKYTILLR